MSDKNPDPRLHEMGKKIETLLLQKGWNMSELAREASKHMPGTKELTRHRVSTYVAGRQKPEPLRLEAIARALDVTRDDLLPPDPDKARTEPSFWIGASPTDNTMAWIKLDQPVPWDVAIEIANLVKGRRTKSR